MQTQEQADNLIKSSNTELVNVVNKPKTNSFEILMVEDIKPEERILHGLNDKKGLVVKEKVSHSYPEIKFHFVGEAGITKLMKDIEAGRV